MAEPYLYVQFYQGIKVNNQHGLSGEILGKLVLKNSGTFIAMTVSHSHVGLTKT